MSRAALMAFITANATGFHAAMARVRGDAKASSAAAGRDFAAMSARIRGVGGAVAAGIRGGPAGIASALGLGIVADQAAKAVRHVEELGAAAKTAGVDFEAFQELRYAAERGLVGVDALTDGLKEMQLRIDEVIKSGKGPAAESLGRLGYTADELARKLKAPDRLFEEIIGRLKTLDKAARIRVADEIFGGSAGEQFVRLMDESRGSIEDNRKAARDLGLVISNDVRAAVDEMSLAWKGIGDVIGGKVTSATMHLLALLGNALDRYEEIENRSIRNLDVAQVDTDTRRLEIENEILKLRDKQRNNSGVLAQTENRIMDGTIRSLEDELGKLTSISERITNTKTSRITKRDAPPQPAVTESSLGSSPAKRDKAAEAAARERKAILELMVTLEDEYNLIGASEADKRVNVELRKLSTEAVKEYGTALEQMIRRNIEANAAHERANELMEEQQELAERFQEDVLSNLEGVLTKAQSVEEALINIGFAALRSLLDVQKLGGGLNQIGGKGGGGLLGGLLGGLGRLFGGSSTATADPWAGLRVPSFDGGGSTGRGPRAGGIDGKGGFAAVLHPNETVVDHWKGPQAEPVMQASGDIQVQLNTTIDASGADPAAIARLSEAVSKMEQSLPGRVIGVVKDAQKRRVI